MAIQGSCGAGMARPASYSAGKKKKLMRPAGEHGTHPDTCLPPAAVLGRICPLRCRKQPTHLSDSGQGHSGLPFRVRVTTREAPKVQPDSHLLGHDDGPVPAGGGPTALLQCACSRLSRPCGQTLPGSAPLHLPSRPHTHPHTRRPFRQNAPSKSFASCSVMSSSVGPCVRALRC